MANSGASTSVAHVSPQGRRTYEETKQARVHNNLARANTPSGYDLTNLFGREAAWQAILRGELKAATWEEARAVDWDWALMPEIVVYNRYKTIMTTNPIPDKYLDIVPQPPAIPCPDSDLEGLWDWPRKAMKWLVKIGFGLRKSQAALLLLHQIDKEYCIKKLHGDVLEGRKRILYEPPDQRKCTCDDVFEVCPYSFAHPETYPRLFHVIGQKVGEPDDSKMARDFVREFLRRPAYLRNVEDLEKLVEGGYAGLVHWVLIEREDDMILPLN